MQIIKKNSLVIFLFFYLIFGSLASINSGISFDENMLSWDKGPLKEDGLWAKYWYKNVHKSSGFQKYHPKTAPFPKKLLPLLKECQPYYDKLMKMAN